MSLAVVIVIAIAIPALLVVQMIAAESFVPERKTAGWQRMRYVGSLLRLGGAAVYFVVAGVILYGAVQIREHAYTGLALCLYLISRGVRDVFLWLPTRDHERMAHRVRSGLKILGFGYLSAGLILVVAAFRETWWALLFAAFSLWFAVIYFLLPRQLSPSE